jgi:hypothetical protein
MCTAVRTTSPEASGRRNGTRLGAVKTGRHVAATLLVAALPACYNYVPIGRSQLAPSSYLAVRLTDPGSDLLTTYLGPEVRVVRGHFMRADQNAFVLSVASIESRRGDSYSWQGETVTMPSEFIWTMEERHPARAKTALLALASIAGFVVTYAAFGPGASGTTPSGGGQGPAPH